MRVVDHPEHQQWTGPYMFSCSLFSSLTRHFFFISYTYYLFYHSTFEIDPFLGEAEFYAILFCVKWKEKVRDMIKLR